MYLTGVPSLQDGIRVYKAGFMDGVHRAAAGFHDHFCGKAQILPAPQKLRLGRNQIPSPDAEGAVWSVVLFSIYRINRDVIVRRTYLQILQLITYY